MYMNQNRNKYKIELLAPAGNYECFLGAMQAGADAVYLGGSKFGARAYADNFTDEEIVRAITYAHVLERKVYLTVNTLVKEEELPDLIPFISPFYEAGLDGVIIQDLGVFALLKEAFPALSLHVSTQMTVTGAYGAAYLKSMGAERIVPARELSLEEIRSIKEKTGIEIEAFVHGAMCYCYSGQCLMSSLIGGRSGNRGRCAQPCRLPFQVETAEGRWKKESYPLSMKDMCTLSILPDLIEAGVDSFKIEGRMKKPEYAAGVTAIYRKYIDLYCRQGRAGYQVDNRDLAFLSSLYIRSGIQEGYYHKQNGADMITLTSPAYNGSEEDVLLSIRKQYLKLPADQRKKQAVIMQITLHKGKRAQLRIEIPQKDLPNTVTVSGSEVLQADKKPITAENVTASLRKLGDTFFSVREEDIHIQMDTDCFYPLKALNDLRRQGMEEVTALYQKNDRKILPVCKDIKKESVKKEKTFAHISFSVLVSCEEQLQALLQSEFSYDTVYLESDFYKKDGLNQKDLLKLQQMEKKVFIAMPYIVRNKDEKAMCELYPLIKTADGVLVRNLESLAFLLERKYEGQIRLDAGMYCFNHRAVKHFENIAESFCLPYELNRREQTALKNASQGKLKTEHVVYGRLPLMVTANCTQKTMEKCIRLTSGQMAENLLTDRYRKQFPVMLHCRYCYNVILNCLPLSLHDTIQIQTDDILRLQFTVENGKETEAVLSFFSKVKQGIQTEPPYKDYTKGHEKRGIE